MDEIFSKILESGILGALVLLLAAANFYQYRESRSFEKQTISDYKEVIDKTTESTSEQRTLLTQILDYFKALKNEKTQ